MTSTVNSPENEIIGFPVQSLGPGDDKLHIRYSILVKQSSVSREFYNYWKQLMDANENIGGIYDKIPAQIDGKCFHVVTDIGKGSWKFFSFIRQGETNLYR